MGHDTVHKDRETKVIKSNFKGSEMFTVVADNYDPEDPKARPVLNMGIKKAKLVLEHLEELRAYVGANK